MIRKEYRKQGCCEPERVVPQRVRGAVLSWVVVLALLVIPLEAARNVPLPSDPFGPTTWIRAMATWGEQKAEAAGIAVNQYRDEMSGHYFGFIFGQRANKSDYDSDSEFEAIHTIQLPDGAPMSWWEEVDYSWSQTERDYSYRVTADGDSTLYYYFWDTTYRVFSKYSRTGVNPPDPMPATFKVTVACQISDVEYVSDSGLTIMPRSDPEEFEFYLSAQQSDFQNADMLAFGEQMDDMKSSGLWRRYWEKCEFSQAELALIFDLTAKMRMKAQGKPCEMEEKVGQD